MYFEALRAESAKMPGMNATGRAELLDELQRLAICAKHYAVAMRELRSGPKAMRAKGPGKVHDEFEREARTFIIKWVATGRSLKGYGWHMWASLPKLFRQFGCLELFCQTAMEGTIGKLGRIMPHVATHARGKYKKEDEAQGPERVQEVLEQRRAGCVPIEEAVYDELQAEATFAEYEYLPCRKRSQGYQYTLKEIMGLIDKEIAEGRVQAYKDWVAAWQRYMGVTAFMCKVQAWAKLARSRKHAARLRRRPLTYGEKLLEEYRNYYKYFPLRKPDDPAADDLTRAAEQRARKRDWKEMQDRMREDSKLA